MNRSLLNFFPNYSSFADHHSTLFKVCYGEWGWLNQHKEWYNKTFCVEIKFH
jgi:hypothetical protein